MLLPSMVIPAGEGGSSSFLSSPVCAREGRGKSRWHFSPSFLPSFLPPSLLFRTAPPHGTPARQTSRVSSSRAHREVYVHSMYIYVYGPILSLPFRAMCLWPPHRTPTPQSGHRERKGRKMIFLVGKYTTSILNSSPKTYSSLHTFLLV